MKKIVLFCLCIILTIPNLIAQNFNLDTIIYNGPSHKYINFVILGDGYSASEMSTYHNDVIHLSDNFFNKVPFSNYRNYFNLISIQVISPQSGIGHPRTANDCPSSAEFPTFSANNYFGTSFDVSGIHRLLYPASAKFALLGSVVNSHVPDYDQIMILANSPQYGGAGGAYAVGSTHPLAVEIMLHEVGHSFGELADEYWAGDYYAGEKPNMTHQNNANTNDVKWKNWLNTGGVDIYPHGSSGVAAQWYKPHTNCEMEFLEREFCSVCRQQIVQKIQSLVNPIEAYEPTNLNIDTPSNSIDFKLTKLILPSPNTLKIEWQHNNTIVAQNIDTFSLPMNAIGNEGHTVIAIVTDTTNFLRTDASYTLNVNKVIWKINGGDTSSVHIREELVRNEYKVFPNPAQNSLNIQSKNLNPQDILAVQLSNISGQVVYNKEYHATSEQFQMQIDTKEIPAGIYTIQVITKKGIDALKVTIKK